MLRASASPYFRTYSFQTGNVRMPISAFRAISSWLAREKSAAAPAGASFVPAGIAADLALADSNRRFGFFMLNGSTELAWESQHRSFQLPP